MTLEREIEQMTKNRDSDKFWKIVMIVAIVGSIMTANVIFVVISVGLFLLFSSMENDKTKLLEDLYSRED